MATVNRRNSILDAARLEFSSAGYSGGRIERIAAAANVNKQLIFHYFRSKDGVYSAVVLAAISRFRLPSASSTSPPDALRAAIRSVVGSMDADDMLVASVVDCATGAGIPEEARVAVAEWERSVRGAIRNVVADGQRQGFFRDDIWPDSIAEHVVNECLGRAVRRVIASVDIAHQETEPSNNKTSIGDWVDYCAWR